MTGNRGMIGGCRFWLLSTFLYLAIFLEGSKRSCRSPNSFSYLLGSFSHVPLSLEIGARFRPLEGDIQNMGAAILMKCLMVFMRLIWLGSRSTSVATQKVSWLMASSKRFRLAEPVLERSLKRSSMYSVGSMAQNSSKARMDSCVATSTVLSCSREIWPSRRRSWASSSEHSVSVSMLLFSWILSASFDSWSGSRLCLMTPSGVTDTSHREYASGAAVRANSLMAWATTSFAVVSFPIMMYRDCWSALKTRNTWSDISVDEQRSEATRLLIGIGFLEGTSTDWFFFAARFPEIYESPPPSEHICVVTLKP
ncbi:hypothetical protein EYF80_028055 [Liparis tanakae]|uniref:Uncharacterized protein n=1 Tax=Liparis tanakae TaxID=230148 RepID=A0A4Z2H9G5_9TELE|nr:hypothetical protein EYF80_028055 [Liparis tanakae]